MSNLRDQLDRAKAEYHSAAYPGDLASELLTMQLTGVGAANSVRNGPVTKNRWFWAGGTTSAAAAALVAAFMLSSSTPDVNPTIDNAGYPFGTRGSMVSVPSTANPFVLADTLVPPAGNRFVLEEAGGTRLRNGGIQMVDSPSTRPTGKDLSLQPRLRTLEYQRP